MRKKLLPVCAAGLLLANVSLSLTAQDAFASYLRAKYPLREKIALGHFLTDAARDGLLRTPADRVQAKRAWRSLAARDRLRGVPRQVPFTAPVLPAGGAAPTAAIAETEHNDSVGWADILGAQTSANGVLATGSDVDVYRFVVGSDMVVQASVVAGTSGPVLDPDLRLTDAVGKDIAYNDDSGTGFYPALGVHLTAGVYHLHVGSVAGSSGSYVLNVATTASVLPVVVPSTTINGTVSGTFDPAWRLIVPGDSLVKVTVSGGTLDMVLSVRTQTGARYALIDDTSAGTDPGFVGHLPSGIYALSFAELYGTPGTFNFRVDITSSALPAAPCAATANGNLLGEESWDLYKLVLGAPARIHLQLSGGASSPVNDTVLYVYDAKLNLALWNDEDINSSLSLLDASLPAGTYYLVVTPYYGDFGAYGLTATCNLAVTASNATFGRTASSILTSGDTATFKVQIGTPNPLEAYVVDTSTNGFDGTLSVLDAKGLAVLFNEDARGSLDPFDGAMLAPGEHWVCVREWGNATGSFDLHVQPPMFFADPAMRTSLQNLDKAGQQLYLFVGLQRIANPLPLPPLTGNLLIDPALIAFVGQAGIPASGTYTWGLNFAPYQIVLQGVSLQPTLATASFTDLVY